jgi:hypothetical protein
MLNRARAAHANLRGYIAALAEARKTHKNEWLSCGGGHRLMRRCGPVVQRDFSGQLGHAVVQ